jgi:hypothetical protein
VNVGVFLASLCGVPDFDITTHIYYYLPSLHPFQFGSGKINKHNSSYKQGIVWLPLSNSSGAGFIEKFGLYEKRPYDPLL